MTKSVLGKSMRLLTLVLMLLAALQVQAASKIYYVHSDHLATPQKLTDEAQNVVWSADYTPFGKAIVDEDPDGNGETVEMSIRFPGQYFDVATGLYYNYFRDYDPTLGRYIQSDPIGLAGGINTYAYVGGNPLRYSDPYGLCFWDACIAEAALAAAAAAAVVGACVSIDCHRTIPEALGNAASAASDAISELCKDDDDGKKCKLQIQRVGGSWPGIPLGKVQCTYECKTKFGITKITRIMDGNSCPSEVDFVEGGHGF